MKAKRKTTKKKTTKRKRRETPATKRLKRENAALQGSVAELALSLKKERLKSSCFHDASHRFTVPRTLVDGRMVKVAMCGYCGRELSTEHLNDEATAARLLDEHRARNDKPKSANVLVRLVEELDHNIDTAAWGEDWYDG